MMFAYIDPGLGALLWQTIIAAVVGILFYLKQTRQWIVNVFRKIFGRAQKAESTAAKGAAGAEGLATKVEAKTEVP